jgi:hypothetical protein
MKPDPNPKKGRPDPPLSPTDRGGTLEKQGDQIGRTFACGAIVYFLLHFHCNGSFNLG